MVDFAVVVADAAGSVVVFDSAGFDSALFDSAEFDSAVFDSVAVAPFDEVSPLATLALLESR